MEMIVAIMVILSVGVTIVAVSFIRKLRQRQEQLQQMLQQVQEEKQQLAIAIEALNKAVGALFSAEARDISEIALQHPSVKAVWQQVQQREAGWQQLLQDLQIIAEGDISHLKQAENSVSASY